MKMKTKYYAKATRDFTREIRMGALVITGLQSGSEREIAPPNVHVLQSRAGDTTVHRTKRERDAYIAAINTDHPGAVVAA